MQNKSLILQKKGISRNHSLIQKTKTNYRDSSPNEILQNSNKSYLDKPNIIILPEISSIQRQNHSQSIDVEYQLPQMQNMRQQNTRDQQQTRMKNREEESNQIIQQVQLKYQQNGEVKNGEQIKHENQRRGQSLKIPQNLLQKYQQNQVINEKKQQLKPEFKRSWQYEHNQMQEHLRPKNLIGWESDKQSHYETESKRQYQSHQETIQDTVKSQRIINPYYKIKERRMYDIYGLNILAKATERNILDSNKVRKDEIKQIFDDVSSKYNEEDYLLTPCRFSKSGWKYVKKNQDQKFLNHPNKLNSIGYGKASQQYSNYQNSSLGRIDEESHLNFNTSELCKQSELHFLTPIKTTNVRASSQLISDDYSTAKSHYKQIYDDKLIESKTINNIRSKDVKEKERDKEYQYPPLPNLVNAKKAYLKSRLDQNLSVIVPSQQDMKNLSPNRESMSNLNISMPDIQNVNISYSQMNYLR